MNTQKKILKLIKNKDIRQFLFFLVKHPISIKSLNVRNNKMPPYLTEYKLINNRDNVSACSIKKINFPGMVRESNKFTLLDDDFIKIRLAGIDDKINLKNVEWEKCYLDPEDVASLHRFFWLYRIIWENKVVDNPEINKKIKEIIYSWIDVIEKMDKKDVHSEVWQTYSVVERLINWVIVLGLTEVEDDNDKKIVESIIRQLEHIQDNFEYYGDYFTSNHFCNNGRGLYICGAILGIECFSLLGKRIIVDMLEKIVPDNRFLREGSVHYQFLITKWICDCLWIAKNFDDNDFADWLEHRLKGLLNGCEYFLLYSEQKVTIPFIGDISPDLVPDWLMGVPYVAKYLLFGKMYNLPFSQKGYHSMIPQAQNMLAFDECINNSSIKGNNDWQKICLNDFIVYAHVNNSLYPNNLTGHFHHDSGSFVAYFKNIPLFIDRGRVNYMVDGVGSHMKNYYGHNLFVIDGFNPEPDMRAFYTRDFLNYYIGASPVIRENNGKIIMTMYGGKWIKGIKYHRRIIKITHTSIVVQDSVEGNGLHNGFILFHLPNFWNVTEEDGNIKLENNFNVLMIRSNSCDFKICSNEQNIEHYGYSSNEYGKLNPCISIRANVRFKVSCNITTIIEKI